MCGWWRETMSQNDAETPKSGVEDGTEGEFILVPYIEVAPNLFAPMPESAITIHKTSNVLTSASARNVEP
jgi:hypothetical protein